MTLRLRFELADALLQAGHAAGCAAFVGPWHDGDRVTVGPADPASTTDGHRPAVLLVAADVLLISNGSPSQVLDRRHLIAFPHAYGQAVTAAQVRAAAGLPATAWLNYPLPATDPWVNLARQALSRGFEHLVIDIDTNDIHVGVARRRHRSATTGSLAS